MYSKNSVGSEAKLNYSDKFLLSLTHLPSVLFSETYSPLPTVLFLGKRQKDS